jgi:hypothetical protein
MFEEFVQFRKDIIKIMPSYTNTHYAKYVKLPIYLNNSRLFNVHDCCVTALLNHVR